MRSFTTSAKNSLTRATPTEPNADKLPRGSLKAAKSRRAITQDLK